MIMPLFKKIEFVNEDFLKSGLYHMGEPPGGKTSSQKWYDEAKQEASAFILRYKGKGAQVEKYVYSLVSDFMDNADRIYLAKREQKAANHKEDLEKLKEKLNTK